MQSFLVSHAIYAIVVLGVLEAMCIPISSELTFLLGGAIASGAVQGAHQHPSLALVIILGTAADAVGDVRADELGRAALTSPTASAGRAGTRWCAAGAGTCS
jgi:membrane protein DedA with SNARE-associated domain